MTLVNPNGIGNLVEVADKIDALCPSWAKKDSWVLCGIRGSHAHGTYIPPEDKHGTDDTDVFIVTLQPEEHYLGLNTLSSGHEIARDVFETAGDDIDILIYDIRKFVNLLRFGNPNVNNYLWTNAGWIIHAAVPGVYLTEQRNLFLSKLTLGSLAGYAKGQIQKASRFSTQGYMGAKRKALVEEYGYDVKSIAHAVRLLYQGIHLALDGILCVQLPEAELNAVKSIKRGERPIDWVHNFTKSLISQYEAAVQTSPLKDATVDVDKVNEVLIRAMRMGWTSGISS